MMQHIFSKQFWIAGSLIAADSLFFGITNPAKVPSATLILGFLLLAISLNYLFRALLVGFSWYGLPTKRHSKQLGRLLSGLATGLLALQSIGELSLRDVLVLLPLAVIMYMYLTYGQTEASN